MGPNVALPPAYKFNGFTVDPIRRRVFRQDGAALPLSSRAYEVLVHLIEHRSRVVSKSELLTAVWPNLVVEENNLGQAVSMLRRAFGDSRQASEVIATIPGRGYRFVAPLTVDVDARQDASRGIGTDFSAFATPVEAPVAVPEQPSLAALPFVNLSRDPSQAYFVEGMMQEIVTSLCRIRSLFVVAGSATMSMMDQAHDPQAAARRLGVRYILQGSVRREGSKVRIVVRLTDASNGQQIWADRFEDDMVDVFALQDRVALSIAGAVEPSIAAAELRRVARGPVEHLGCYDLYLRASHLRTTLRKHEVMQALELLDQALALDPEFAPALAQAAGCHSQIYANRWADDFEAHRQQGLRLAERAERAAGDDASVLTYVANALMDLNQEPSHNIDRALALVERATAINPGSAYAWFVSGVLKLVDGEGDVAVDHLQRALRLDPISPLSEAARAHIGIGRALQGAYEEALGILLTTSYWPPRIRLVVACLYAQLGHTAKAREQLNAYEQLCSVPAETMLAHATRNPRLHAWLQEMIARARGLPDVCVE
jgi:TolB-like protein